MTQTDFLKAQLSEVESLIEQMTPRDFVTRMSLESRRDEIKVELTATQPDAAPRPADNG